MTMPDAVERYLDELLRARARPLLLTFDADWQLVDLYGDTALHGLDADAPQTLVHQLQDLFLGLPHDQPQDLPFVELAAGRNAHVHLVPDGSRFHLLLLDASDEHGRVQVQQPLGNDATAA